METENLVLGVCFSLITYAKLCGALFATGRQLVDELKKDPISSTLVSVATSLALTIMTVGLFFFWTRLATH